MPLRLDTFQIWLQNDPPTAEPSEHHVTVTFQDQLRAESAMAAAGIDYRTHPLAMTGAWVWAAALRAQLVPTGTKLRDFLHGLLVNVEEIKGAELDPTRREEPTGPSSPAQLTSQDFPGAPAPTTD